MAPGAWLLTLLLALAGPAGAQPAKTSPPAEAASLPAYPAMVGAWRRDTITDYEARSGGAGLGSGANYMPVDGRGGAATFYVYDRGRRDLRDGAESAEVAAELAQTIREVEMIGPQRRYQLAARLSLAPLAGPDGRPAMQCEAMTLRFETEGVRRSIACVGVAGGRFVKLRLTRPDDAPGDAEKLAHAFGREMLGSLALAPVPAGK